MIIDYDLVAIMMPTTLAGAQIGSLILVAFPSVTILATLTIILALLTIQSVLKAIEITRKENKEREKKPEVQEEEAPAEAVAKIQEKEEEVV